MSGFFTRGVILEQNKEPALSKEPLEFLNNNAIAAFDGPVLPEGETPEAEWILQAARKAGIVDENTGSLLFDELNAEGIACVVADAIDDEPYVSSQINLLLKRGEELAEGLKLAQKALGASKSYIAVYKNISDVATRIPRKAGGIQVKRIRGRYPAELRAKKDVSKGHKALFIGANALVHLTRAVYQNRIQTTAFVTVAGNCVGNPCNLETSLGMPISHLLERCGLVRDPNKIIIGGPMTGICVIDPENTLVTAKTRAVLAIYEDVKNKNYQCIGCGRCVDVCPENLSPYYFYKNTERGLYPRLPFYEIERCIECGTCTYVCPSKIDILDFIRLGKKEVLKEKQLESKLEQERRAEQERSDEWEGKLVAKRWEKLLEKFPAVSAELRQERKKKLEQNAENANSDQQDENAEAARNAPKE